MTHKGFTIWLTGARGAGKTTLARLVKAELKNRGRQVEVLDDDIISDDLSKGSGYSKEDRDADIRRIGFACGLLTRNGVIAIAAATSPCREIRNEVRRQIGEFVEVYVKCRVEVLAGRNAKGSDKKAAPGEIEHLIGADDPYEEPLAPEIIVTTDAEPPDQSAAHIIQKLEQMSLIATATTPGYGEEEEEEIRRRLEALGYV